MTKCSYERLEAVFDKITLEIHKLNVTVTLNPDQERLSQGFDRPDPPMYGRLTVVVSQPGEVYHTGEILVKLPHHLHQYNVDWNFVTERAHRLAHDSVDKVRQKMWEALIK